MMRIEAKQFCPSVPWCVLDNSWTEWSRDFKFSSPNGRHPFEILFHQCFSSSEISCKIEKKYLCKISWESHRIFFFWKLGIAKLMHTILLKYVYKLLWKYGSFKMLWFWWVVIVKFMMRRCSIYFLEFVKITEKILISSLTYNFECRMFYFRDF